jgi:hypothetical protein
MRTNHIHVYHSLQCREQVFIPAACTGVGQYQCLTNKPITSFVYPSTTRCRENSLHARNGQPLPASVKQQHEALFQQFESYLEQLQDNASTSQQLTVAQARDTFVQQQSLSVKQQNGLDFQINTRIEQVGHVFDSLALLVVVGVMAVRPFVNAFH